MGKGPSINDVEAKGWMNGHVKYLKWSKIMDVP